MLEPVDGEAGVGAAGGDELERGRRGGDRATGSTGGGFPSGYHRLVIAKNSLCLDVYGNTGTAGAAIDGHVRAGGV